MSKLTKAELRKLLNNKIPIGTKMLHIKSQGQYQITGYAFNTETEEVDVCYSPVDDATLTFSRPYHQCIDGRFVFEDSNHSRSTKDLATNQYNEVVLDESILDLDSWLPASAIDELINLLDKIDE